MNSLLLMYPSAVVAGPVNPKYNCHAYAWHSQSTHQYWINDPSMYILDGSYSYTTTVSSGRKVTYVDSATGIIIHSGIVTSSPSGSSPTRVTSKWGFNALFTHDIDDCPYAGSGVLQSFWKS